MTENGGGFASIDAPKGYEVELILVGRQPGTGGYWADEVPSTHQLAHGLGPVRDEEIRAATQVRHSHLVHVDAEVVVERGEDFAEGNRALAGFAAQTISGADNLACSHAAARQHGAVGARPMVAAGVLVDGRGAA